MVALLVAQVIVGRGSCLPAEPVSGYTLEEMTYSSGFYFNTCAGWDYPNERMQPQIGYGTCGIAILQIPAGLGNPVRIDTVEFCVTGTGEHQALIWIGLPGLDPPGPPGTQSYTVAFTPLVASGHPDSSGVAYTPVDVSDLGIVLDPGEYLAFGCTLDPGDYIGVVDQLFPDGHTYAFWQGDWDSDAPWGWTACHQIGCSDATALEPGSWGSIKTLFLVP
jgi:hypothetical protein